MRPSAAIIKGISQFRFRKNVHFATIIPQPDLQLSCFTNDTHLRKLRIALSKTVADAF